MRPQLTFPAIGFALAAFSFSGAAQSNQYRYTTLDMPGCIGTAARGINNAGQIVGSCTQAARTLGFVYSEGTFSSIEFPNAAVTNPSGIDSAGQIVGSYAVDDGVPHGFLYAGGSFSTIDSPGATATQALAINDLGQIVGAFTDSRGGHGFLYQGGNFTTLDVPGAVSTSATGIDNSGEIAGWFTDANSRLHGFRYVGGVFSSSNAPTDTLAVNAAGQIVGTYFDARGVSHGFLETPLALSSLTSGAFPPRSAEPVTASRVKPTAKTSSCNAGNGLNITNVRAIIDQALGIAAPNSDLTSDGVVNVADIQVVVNDVLQIGCSTGGSQGSAAVAHLTVQSGNGQAACICLSATLQAFQPISVKATDSSGNPVSGATVTWTNISAADNSGPMSLNSGPTTVTDSTGVATQNISFAVFQNYSSTAVPDDVFGIQAASNNVSVTFTETQSLVTGQGSSLIFANSPQYSGQALSAATLSANSGTTLTTPIKTQIAGTGVASNGVPNVSVRVFNGQSSPAVTCTTGANADPGSVLSDSQGNTSCYLTFSGGGTGVFYLLIGGVAGTGTNIKSALDLEYLGPYTFTSVGSSGGAGGAPAAVQIVSGNNQVAAYNVTLAPLVAKLVDAQGNGISGQTMSWSVSPAGAASLNNAPLVTDVNGEVSITGTLGSLASAGVTITAALQSNPSIAVTFNETVPDALTAMTKISGDNQTAAEGATFPISLVVKLVTASGPAEYAIVHYSVTGPVTLDTNVADSDVNGLATVTAYAGSSTGTATVTVTAGALTQTFTLTVIPQ
jgi:probable HAF family extracellular repeat protein